MFSKILRSLLVLGAGTILAVAVGEFLISQTSLVDTPPGLFRRSETRAFEHTPGFHGRDMQKHPIRINSGGLRDAETPFEKPDGVYRIFVLGDSVAFGDGVAVEDTFSDQLEKMLNDRGVRVEVLNGGIRGYNTYQESILLKEAGLRYHPDLILLTYVANDAEPFSRQQGLIGKNHPRLLYLKDFVKQHSYLYAFFRKKIEVLRHRVTPRQFSETYDEHFQPDHEGWKASYAAMADIRDTARASNAGLLLSVFPRLVGLGEGETHSHQKIHDQILAAGRELGIDTMDMLAALKGQSGEKLRITPGDHFHPNPEGHRLIAQKLAERIEADFLSKRAA